MKFSSILAIYALFWALCFFFVLPFRLAGRVEAQGKVRGQAESAPAAFSFGRTCLWTTIVSAAAFGLYYANYVNGWIRPDQLDFFTSRRGS